MRGKTYRTCGTRGTHGTRRTQIFPPGTAVAPSPEVGRPLPAFAVALLVSTLVACASPSSHEIAQTVQQILSDQTDRQRPSGCVEGCPSLLRPIARRACLGESSRRDETRVPGIGRLALRAWTRPAIGGLSRRRASAVRRLDTEDAVACAGQSAPDRRARDRVYRLALADRARCLAGPSRAPDTSVEAAPHAARPRRDASHCTPRQTGVMARYGSSAASRVPRPSKSARRASRRA